jgi:DNA replication protein DnaC
MPHSEPTQVARLSSFRRLLERLEARKAWEAANPELASEWNEALREDDERTRRREIEEAAARLDLDMPRILRGLGAQAVHAEATAFKLSDWPTLKAARRFLAQPRPPPYPTLFLAGPTATGKTQAAVFALADWARRHNWTERATGEERPQAIFAKAIEATSLNRFNGDGGHALERFKRAPVLVLDDLGTQAATGPGASLLYEIIDARYGERRRTVVTTNLGAKELQRDYDERLLRRLRETSMCLLGSALFEGGKKVEGWGQ